MLQKSRKKLKEILNIHNALYPKAKAKGFTAFFYKEIEK